MDVKKCKEIPPKARSRLPKRSSGTQLITMGRWVSIHNEIHGLVRRAIMPRYGRLTANDKAEHFVKPLLLHITGRQELDKLILLLAPSTKQNFHRKLHCFDLDTYKHLCSTCITQRELELMQRYEMLFKYMLVSTNEYLPIKSLACDSSIIQEIVETHLAKQRANDEPEPPKIKSLRLPKIPVRLRLSDVNRIKKKKAGDAGEPVWKL